jgi:uncharacterized Zn finger protein
MMPQPTKSRKPAYKPHVQKVADNAYTCQSETYTYVLYLVTVRGDGSTVCECTAGQHGRDCKHGKAVRAYMAYRANPTHFRPVPVQTSAAGLLAAFGVE